LEKDARIYVAGRRTLIGAALVRELERQGYSRLVGVAEGEPELTAATAVDAFFARTRPEYVFVAAGRSGGIAANQRYPADLMRENLLVGCHVIDGAYRYGVTKLLYLGSSCSYPKHCGQPMPVEALLTGALEPTSEPYALAKIAGMRLCQSYRRQYAANFIAAVPADAFGPGDDFSPDDSHVIAALMRRMHEAKRESAPHVDVWGTGRPRREFIFCDDLAEACLLAMREYEGPEPINLGTGQDLSIAELAAAIQAVVGFGGALRFDPSRPDGMPRKLLDSSALRAMGWRPRTPFRAALAETYNWFLKQEGRTDAR
jgi:GDP-L-fucose synthase